MPPLYTLKLEFIGENNDALLRAFEGQVETILGEGEGRRFVGYKYSGPWVARITGLHERFIFERQFIDGQKDYSKANSVGSRGVYLYFYLEPGLYDAKKHVSWKRNMRFFFRIDESGLTELTKEEMLAAVKSELATSLPY